MSKTIPILLAGMVLGAAIGAAAKQVATPRSTYTDTTYGFTVQAPRFPKAPAKGTAMPVIFNAPAEDAFASNFGLIVQNVKTTRKAYQELTSSQFQQAGITPLSEKVKKVAGKDAVEWEYETDTQGRPLHFLQVAVIDTDRVLLATCTSPADQFKKYEPEFRASLASIKLTAKK